MKGMKRFFMFFWILKGVLIRFYEIEIEYSDQLLTDFDRAPLLKF